MAAVMGTYTPIKVQAIYIREGDQVRFPEHRSDGVEAYVVGRVEGVYREMLGLLKFKVRADWWNVTDSQMIEVLK